MLGRKELEKREYDILSPLAAKAADSKGRLTPEDECDNRTCFQRDRDRIIHAKAFRRLMHKTQVFLAPEGDHYRTRLTHTLEVSQIARTISRGLGLNEDLTEAIALGHDLGHTPFGHNGEAILSELYPKGFRHNEQSLRVVDVLESHGTRNGMNLTREVRDGIVNHTGPVKPFTLEGQVVKTSDRIAYINHDIDDAIRSDVIGGEDLPPDCLAYLGKTHSERIDTLVKDMIRNSDGRDEASLSEEAAFYMNKLRTFMFENVYLSSRVKKAADLENVKGILSFLYGYYSEHFEELPEDLRAIEGSSREELVKDHIAGMTDRYAINIKKTLSGD